MRRNNVKKAAEARARWEDDTYDDLMSRIDKARDVGISWVSLSCTLGAS